MAGDDPFEPVYVFFPAWFGLTLAVFPLVATIDSVVFDGSLGTLVVLVGCVVLTIPAALEFLFSDRNPRLVGWFVGVFVILYFLAIVVQAGVYVAVDQAETIPALEFGVLFATYVLAYLLVYRGGLARLTQGVTR